MEMMHDLPLAVQKWLLRSGMLGREFPRSALVNQRGRMRTKPDGKWMRFQASEYFNIDEPGFTWTADVRVAPFIHLHGKDEYRDGHGTMLIKLLGLLPVINSKGPEIDQGAMLRYLAESAWFPSFALSSYLRWEEMDLMKAKATFDYKGTRTSGIFGFNSEGDNISFEAKRYYSGNGRGTMEDWSISTEKHDFKEFGGIRIPAKSSVTWKLKDGDYTWLEMEITDLEYDKNA